MGRCSTASGYLVLYLGRPEDSVVIEGYRHLIDPVVDDEGRVPPIKPRTLLTCKVSVSRILDLRLVSNRKLAGLSMSQMQSETYDTAAYAACQNVSAVAHQLGYHGLIAPAATKLGEALTLFMDVLPASEQPVRISQKRGLYSPKILERRRRVRISTSLTAVNRGTRRQNYARAGFQQDGARQVCTRNRRQSCRRHERQEGTERC